MLTETLAVLAIWLLATVSFVGLGLALRRIIGSGSALRPETIFTTFWIGWASGLVFLQVWHLFSPIGISAVICLIVLGLAGLLWNATAIIEWQHQRSVFVFAYLAIVIILMGWLANRALGPPNIGDMGIYHLPTVRWNTTYPIITGLGNLHGRLAFNSTHFLYASLFEVGGLHGKAHHFANGLLLLVYAARVCWLFVQKLTRSRKLEICEMFTLLVAVFLPYLFFSSTTNYSNDLPVFLLGAIIGEQLCRLFFSRVSFEEADEIAFTIIFLSAAGITVKLSFTALGVMACIAALLRWKVLRKDWKLLKLIRRSLTWSVALVMLLLWIGRGIILSGYPVYPITLGAVNVIWRVPPEQVVEETRSIAAWGRAPFQPPDEVLSDWDWLLPKLKKGLGRIPEFILPLSLGGLGIILLAARRFPILSSHNEPGKVDLISSSESIVGRNRIAAITQNLLKGETVLKWPVLFLLPPLVSLVVWFFTAPNIRFVGIGFWWLGAGTLALGLGQLRRSVWFLVVCILLFMSFFAIYAFRDSLWLTSGPKNGLRAAPVVTTQEYVTLSGLQLNVPEEGDQCWDAPLPCTPHPNPRLRLRTGNELGSGFWQSP